MRESLYLYFHSQKLQTTPSIWEIHRKEDTNALLIILKLQNGSRTQSRNGLCSFKNIPSIGSQKQKGKNNLLKRHNYDTKKDYKTQWSANLLTRIQRMKRITIENGSEHLRANLQVCKEWYPYFWMFDKWKRNCYWYKTRKKY